MIKAIAASGVALTVAGCSAISAVAPHNQPAATTQAAAPVAVASCILGAAGVDVEVQITNSDSSCAQWVADLAPTGLNWHFLSQMAPPYTAGPADGESMYKVCVLSGGASGDMLVEDAGSATYGNNICSQEETNGWVPHESTQG